MVDLQTKLLNNGPTVPHPPGHRKRLSCPFFISQICVSVAGFETFRIAWHLDICSQFAHSICHITTIKSSQQGCQQKNFMVEIRFILKPLLCIHYNLWSDWSQEEKGILQLVELIVHHIAKTKIILKVNLVVLKRVITLITLKITPLFWKVLLILLRVIASSIACGVFGV